MTQVDLGTLHEIFVQTYHTQQSVREQAEHTLKQLQGNSGFLVSLLQLVMVPEVDVSVKQAASIYFKNQVQRRWDPSEENCIEEGDKHIIKQNFMAALTFSPEVVQNQMMPCMRTMLRHDYPAKWKGILQEVIGQIESEKMEVVYGGLVAGQQLACWKRLHGEEKVDIAGELFPALMRIAKKMDCKDGRSWKVLKTIMKTFYTGIEDELPVVIRNERIGEWCGLIVQIMAIEGDGENRTEEDVFWKMKKWAMRSMNKICTRYVNAVKTMREEEYKEFSKMFVRTYLSGVMECYLGLMLRVVHGTFVSNKVKMHLADFLDWGLKHKHPWQMMQPHIEVIVTQFIFQELCFSDEDAQLWEEDPYEYVHKKYDPLDDFDSATSSVMNLLIDIVKERKKVTLFPVLGFVTRVLQGYQQGVYHARHKDGVLCMMGSIASIVLQKKNGLKDQMEEFLMFHVLPEFQSPEGFLRARACWVTEQFSDVEFSTEGNVVKLVQSILGCVKDAELPVKIRAALALGPMIDFEEIRQYIKGHVASVMQEILTLTNESDMEPLSVVMEKMVCNFAEELSPYARGLVTQLSEMFMRMMSELNQQIETETVENSDKLYAASGLLKTITTLLLSLKTSQEILGEIYYVLHPVFVTCLEQSMVDVYDELFEIIETLVLSMQQVPPELWLTVFPLLHKSFKEIASDFINEMMPSLINLIIFGHNFLIENPPFLSLFMDMVQHILASDDFGEYDATCACRILHYLCMYAKEPMVPYIPTIISWILPRAQSSTSKLAIIGMLKVILNCFLCSLDVTLNTLHSHQVFYLVMEKVFTFLPKFSTVSDKKLLLLTFITLLQSPIDFVQSVHPQLFNASLSVLASLPKAIKEQEELENSFDEDDEEDDEEEDEESIHDEEEEDEEDAFGNKDNQKLQNLAEQASVALTDDEDDDEDEWFSQLEEEMFSITPFDSMNVFSTFSEFYASYQSVGAHVLASIDPSHLSNILQLVEALKQ